MRAVEHPERAAAKFAELFETVESYENTSHLQRSHVQVPGMRPALYFHEWYEWVDWDEGDDRSYTT